MVKWSYLAAALAWAVSMVYECLWNGGPAGNYFASGTVGVTLMVILFVRAIGPGSEKRPEPRPMIWFLLAAMVCALFYMAVERVELVQPPHIRLLPMYLVLFVDFLGTGCYIWWKRLKDQHRP